MRVEFEELELPFDEVADAPAAPCVINRDPLGTFPCCPMCGGELRPEHAHFRCACGWRDSCCDGAGRRRALGPPALHMQLASELVELEVALVVLRDLPPERGGDLDGRGDWVSSRRW